MTTFQSPNLRLTAYVGVGVGASLAALYAYNHWRATKNYWNSPLVEVGQVDRLFIYPVKSCKGVEVQTLDCTPRGPHFNSLIDREFIIIDDMRDGMYLSTRIYPRMTLIQAEKDDDFLWLKFPEEKVVKIDLNEVNERKVVKKAILHDNLKTEGLDCGDEVGQMLTQFFNVEGKRSLRLLRFSTDLYTERNQKSSQNFWINKVPTFEDKQTFTDESSYMINTQASVDDLNKRLEADGIQTVDVRFFRPSISVSGAQAFDEDRWLDVKIGDVEFVCFKPCARCFSTTVNPDEGELRKDVNPLKKLREYRLAPKPLLNEYKQSPLFGVHLGLKQAGRIQVGDKVYARRKPTPF